MNEPPAMIWVTNGFGIMSKKPFVEYHDGGYRRQLSPQDARKIANDLIECAEAAEQDAFIVNFAMKELELEEQKAYQLVLMFRAWKEERRKEPRRRTTDPENQPQGENQ